MSDDLTEADMAHGKRSDALLITRELNTQKALEMRLAGGSYRAIAAAMGISKSTVANYIKDALDDIRETQVELTADIRAIEAERLDMAAQAIIQKVQAGDLSAIDRWLRISQQRAALFGANVPTTQNLNLLMNPNGAVDIEPVTDYRAAISSLSPGGDASDE